MFILVIKLSKHMEMQLRLPGHTHFYVTVFPFSGLFCQPWKTVQQHPICTHVV